MYICVCVARASGAQLSRHQPAVEKCKCLRVYTKNVHQPWPLALNVSQSVSPGNSTQLV